MDFFLLKAIRPVRSSAFFFGLIFVWQSAYSQFDTIPTNKGPKSSYNTWRYSSGVTDITDNATGHSASSAYELKGKGIDTIYSPTVKVTSTGSVVGTINLNFADYQENASVGTISAGCFVDAGTSSAATFALKTASGSTSWNTFSYTGNFLSGTHTYKAFFYNQSNNPVAVDDLNFGFTGASSVTLPVSLGAFTAYPKGSSVVLGWSTLTESNNAGFYIERSNNGGNTFVEMSFEASKAINGNSNFKISYDYIDAMPNAGANYYRLRQKDLDGRVTYGTVVALDLNNVVPVKAYPIPAVGTLSLVGAEFGARLRVVSAGSGQTVLSTTVSSSGVDVSTLPPGMYLLETTVKGVPQVLDFIKK